MDRGMARARFWRSCNRSIRRSASCFSRTTWAKERRSGAAFRKPRATSSLFRTPIWNTIDDDDDVEHAPGVRQGMYFLISDRGQRNDDHVETIEPGPSLDVVKAQRAEADHEGQGGSEEFEIAGSPHGSMVPTLQGSNGATIRGARDEQFILPRDR